MSSGEGRGVVHEVQIGKFAEEHATGCYVLDVREVDEYTAGHVPGAVLAPMETLPQKLSDLPKDRPIYVICAVGQRSAIAAQWLGRAGYDAVSVAGGTNAWAMAGKPLVQGMQEQ